MEICARVYRPRRARESPLFRLVEQHLEEFLRVYEVRFAKAHGPLRPVAYITDELSIRRILDHLGLSPPEQEKPPPRREVLRVPVDDEGREIHAG